MAYLSFAPWEAGGGNDIRRLAATAADADRFSTLELRVIGLAERGEPLRRDSGGRLARLFKRAFGVDEHKPLADPRLESLRRFASRARHEPRSISDSDIWQLVKAGYSTGQVHGLLAYFSSRQSHSSGMA